MSKVGTRVTSIDAIEKVTGNLKYGSDFQLPGMLYGKILRSPIPHAKICSIDASQAQKLPGVKAIATGRDYDLPLFSVAGVKNVDDRLLAKKKVRYIGDEVAAVAAVDGDLATEALSKIIVEYEELPAVFDPVEAMRDNSVLVHESVKKNIVNKIQIRHGDVQKSFNESDAVVEATFETPIVHQAYLEPHSAVAQWDFQGRLTLWIPTQSPRLAQMTYANALGISPDKIRIVQLPMGGAFGAKLEYKLHPICALLARKANAPVKMTNTRKDEFTVGVPRLPMKIKMKAGCKKDGTLLAKQAEIIANCGAYVNYSQGIQLSATTRHDNLYRLKNIYTDSYLIYTNTIPKGCFRGFGCPQSFFALESIIDMLAQEIHMDPAEFRLKNAVRTGDTTPHKWYFGSCGLREAIAKATEKADWKNKRKILPTKNSRKKAYGIGLACCLHVSGNRTFLPFFDGAAAYVRITAEGSVNISVGEPDIGQGSRTTFALIAAHELGIHLKSVSVSFADTDISPQGLGTFGDRSTTLTGNAVKNAANDARNQLIDVASKILKVDASDLIIENGIISSMKNQRIRMDFCEASKFASFERAGGAILGVGQFIPPNVTMVDPHTKVGNISCAYPFVAQVAEVEVDLKSGQVKLLSFTAAHDLGKVINPVGAEGQVHGAIAQGIGFALSEEIVLRDGKVTNPSFKNYQVPRAKDMPAIEIIFIESNDPFGPYGAKGLSEPALTPVAPAIANAIYHATGIRVTRLPMTPKRLRNEINSANEKGQSR
jgi:CO/xanthine dehydrogenase Mo-binding subunit